MANPHRGEVALTPSEPVEAEGPESYVFTLRTDEVMQLEKIFDKKFAALAFMLENDLGLRDRVTVLQVGLKRHHGLKDSAFLASLVDAVGPKAVILAIGSAIASAFPDLVEAGQGAREGKAQASTGRRSAARLSFVARANPASSQRRRSDIERSPTAS